MFHVHIWNTEYGFDDVAAYQSCRCGKRRYVQYGTNVKPVDENWLMGKEPYSENESKIPKPKHDPFVVTKR